MSSGLCAGASDCPSSTLDTPVFRSSITFIATGETLELGGKQSIEASVRMSDEKIEVRTIPGSSFHEIVARRVPGMVPARYSYSIRSPVTSQDRTAYLEVSPGVEDGKAGTLTRIDGKHTTRLQVAERARLKTVRFIATGESQEMTGKIPVKAHIRMNKNVLKIETRPPSSFHEIEANRVPESTPTRYSYSIRSPVTFFDRTAYVVVSPEVENGRPGTVTIIDDSHEYVLNVGE